MASKPIDDEEQDLEITTDAEDVAEDDAVQADEGDNEDVADADKAEDDDEIVIAFDGEDDDDIPEGEGETSVIKRLRERDREKTKLLRERERRIQELEQAKPVAKVEVGPKPTIEDCGWDEALYDERIETWKAEKADADAQVTRAEEENRRAQDSWNKDLSAYNARKASIGIPDYEDAETVVTSKLNAVQQAVLVKAATDPAALVIALGRSEAKLAELAKYDDPIKMAAAIARLEGSVKIVKRKKVLAPDRPLKGSASIQNLSADKQLEALEKEAEVTGVRTKVIAFKAALKKKEAK